MSKHHVSEVTSDIFVGDYQTAKNESWLHESRISRIVDCRPRTVTDKALIKTYGDRGIRYVCLNTFWPTQTDVAWHRQILQAITFLAALGVNERVLIHCAHGEERSVTICIAYLMYTHGWRYPHARHILGDRHLGFEPHTIPLIRFDEFLCSYSATQAATHILHIACTSPTTLSRYQPPPTSASSVTQTLPACPSTHTTPVATTCCVTTTTCCVTTTTCCVTTTTCCVTTTTCCVTTTTCCGTTTASDLQHQIYTHIFGYLLNAPEFDCSVCNSVPSGT
jgi:hypothetical protein